MFLVLFGFWLLLNGRWTAEIAITGVVLSLLIYLFAWKFMNYSPKKEWAFLRRLFPAVRYLGVLILEIAKSALATIRLIWSPRLEAEPRLVSFHTRLRTDLGKVILANSITLTPGTITVDIREDKLLVHCLDETFSAELENSVMETRVLRLEEGSKAHE